MVTTSTPVASVVTTMKMQQLGEVAGGLLVEQLHGVHRRLSPYDTVAPRTIGPSSRPPRSGTSVGRGAEGGASRS